jgi:hypothetical protein
MLLSAWLTLLADACAPEVELPEDEVLESEGMPLDERMLGDCCADCDDWAYTLPAPNIIASAAIPSARLILLLCDMWILLLDMGKRRRKRRWSSHSGNARAMAGVAGGIGEE